MESLRLQNGRISSLWTYTNIRAIHLADRDQNHNCIHRKTFTFQDIIVPHELSSSAPPKRTHFDAACNETTPDAPSASTSTAPSPTHRHCCYSQPLMLPARGPNCFAHPKAPSGLPAKAVNHHMEMDPQNPDFILTYNSVRIPNSNHLAALMMGKKSSKQTIRLGRWRSGYQPNLWKLLWRKLRRQKRNKTTTYSSGNLIPYDPFSYSHNFDQGNAAEDPDILCRSFSARFALADAASAFFLDNQLQ
ncbi:hypothetical protein SDJN02_15567, partial [Cucurbita argyrosperma subsp. argyrosperma]